MTSRELCRITTDALSITDPPTWDSPDAPGSCDVLSHIDDAGGDETGWCIMPNDSDDAEYVPVDTVMAGELIRARLRDWLLERGWQVQATLRKEVQRWRLVDVLSIADGGGDRLDDDYPYGPDELVVLCESVVVTAGPADRA